MNEQLYIPKKINVGYQKRTGTYTGKLGYIIYWDDKGVLRKESSWQGWRHKDIEPTAFDNVPTEGFVLNKNVGGARSGGSYGWNARLEKVRVYDPRGFEFEINIPNLLFILQECTSVKGKGLDGEFVYAWSGKELILIPTCCAEYKASVEFTSLQGKNVGKKDMVPGCSYTTKDNKKLIYLGKFNYNFISSYGSIISNCIKQDVFYNSEQNCYVPYDGFKKIATKNTDVPVDNYAELVESFTTGIHASKIIGLTSKPVIANLTHDNSWGAPQFKEAIFQKISDNNFVQIETNQIWNSDKRKYEEDKFKLREYYDIIFENGKLVKNTVYSYNRKNKVKLDLEKTYTIDEINTLNFCKLFIILDSGKEITLEELHN